MVKWSSSAKLFYSQAWLCRSRGHLSLCVLDFSIRVMPFPSTRRKVCLCCNLEYFVCLNCLVCLTQLIILSQFKKSVTWLIFICICSAFFSEPMEHPRIRTATRPRRNVSRPRACTSVISTVHGASSPCLTHPVRLAWSNSVPAAVKCWCATPPAATTSSPSNIPPSTPGSFSTPATARPRTGSSTRPGPRARSRTSTIPRSSRTGSRICRAGRRFRPFLMAGITGKTMGF